MRGEERLAVLLKIALRGFEKAIDPREQLHSGMIGVENHGNAILLGQRANVESARNCSRDGGGVVGIVESFACIELGT